VAATKVNGYRPWEIYRGNAELKAAIDTINSGVFSRGDRELFRPLTEALVQHDPYLLFADYDAYLACQAQVDRARRDAVQWCRMSILNTARMGRFSSDRAISEYCENIWKVRPLPVAPAG
jgi:starch phosphorylase